MPNNFNLRKAVVQDVPKIYDFLKQLAKKGLLLPRSLSNLYEMIQTIWVIEDKTKNNKLIAIGALQIIWENLGEVRSLAVLEEYRGYGLGLKITNAVEDEARKLGIEKMFVLTYVPDFFKKIDYKVIDREMLPQKIWAVCFQCVHYPDCQEIAMMKNL